MANLTRIRVWTLLAVIPCVSAVQAQQTDPAKNDPREPPITPYPAVMPSGGTSDSALDLSQAPLSSVQVAADERPLSGVQTLTLGSSLGARNFLMPSISGMSQFSMNSSASEFYGPEASGYLVGTIDLNQVSDRSTLILIYTGGGMFSNYVNSAIQDLNCSYSIRWRRWSMLMADQASFLSESPFGFGGVGGLAFLSGISEFDPGGALASSLNASLTPNQTIPTIIAPRLSNTVVSQVEYDISPRSSWTASGTFGTLNFVDANFINSAEGIIQTGYNYRLSPQSSIALIYRFDTFRYTGFPQMITNHVVQFGYARYVTGRLSFQVAAGPSVIMLRGYVTGSTNKLSGVADSALTYHIDRTSLLLTYDHFVTSGSGVLIGAQTSQAQAIVERELSPRWHGSLSLGYATNRDLLETVGFPGNGPYNSWYAAVRFTHQFRPETAFFMSYGARLQALNAATCVSPNCGTRFVSHELSAGFNFGLRPILF